MTPPPIYTHACDLFAAFLGSPRTVRADEEIANDYGVRVGDRLYVGHWSTDFANWDGLPGESTQQKAYAWLQAVGCVEVLRRGGRDYPGVILLVREPTVEDAKNAPRDTRANRLGKLGTIEVAVNAHNERIKDVEDSIETISGQHAALVRDIELQLHKLSVRMDEALRNKE